MTLWREKALEHVEIDSMEKYKPPNPTFFANNYVSAGYKGSSFFLPDTNKSIQPSSKKYAPLYNLSRTVK